MNYVDENASTYTSIWYGMRLFAFLFRMFSHTSSSNTPLLRVGGNIERASHSLGGRLRWFSVAMATPFWRQGRPHSQPKNQIPLQSCSSTARRKKCALSFALIFSQSVCWWFIFVSHKIWTHKKLPFFWFLFFSCWVIFFFSWRTWTAAIWTWSNLNRIVHSLSLNLVVVYLSHSGSGVVVPLFKRKYTKITNAADYENGVGLANSAGPDGRPSPLGIRRR